MSEETPATGAKEGQDDGADPPKKRTLRLNRELKVGDLLTAITVGLSVAALVASWEGDRRSRAEEEATRARSAAATALRKLERYRALQLSIFDDVQPVLVRVSKITSDDGRADSAEQVDVLYAEVKAMRARQLERILDEDVITAYTDLLTYKSRLRTLFRETVLGLNRWTGDELEYCALQRAQSAIFDDDNRTAAALGNAMRAAFVHSNQQFEHELEARISPLVATLDCYLADEGRSLRGFQEHVDACDREFLEGVELGTRWLMSCDEPSP